jgi:hypothetical protein
VLEPGPVGGRGVGAALVAVDEMPVSGQNRGQVITADAGRVG